MIPVEQTILGFPDGNCFAACIASILELRLDEVPHDLTNDWWDILTEWLWKRNLEIFYIGKEYKPKGYSIMSADNKYSRLKHAVVAFDGEMVWNPHPMRDFGLGETDGYFVFRVLDPIKGER